MTIQIKKILLPTDFSAPSRNAARYVASFAEEYGARVYILHVIDTMLQAMMLEEMGQGGGNLTQEIEAGVSEEMKGAMPDACKGLDVVYLTRHGKPCAEIVVAARELEVDMIVMGTHGRSGLSHILLGSTAERVVRSAPCPVLTVRHPEHEFVMP